VEPIGPLPRFLGMRKTSAWLAAGLVLGIATVADAQLVAVVLPPTGTAPASGAVTKPLTYVCIFAPDPVKCEPVFRQALKDSSPESISVREAYDRYAKYLKDAHNTLSDADRRYLKANAIVMPDDLTSVQLCGLHNVINDRALGSAEDHKAAVVNYLLRAGEANIYCGIDSCSGGNAS
jgi:hypothetical protein